jgi:hypothetical protein
VIRFRLRKAGMVELVVRTSGECAVLGRRLVRGHEGLNRVRFAGRLHGKPLGLGRYTISVNVVRSGARKRVGTVAVEVVPPGRRLTKAERSAPVQASCGTTNGTSSFPSILIDAVSPLRETSASTSGSANPPKAKKDRPRTSVAGASFKPPTIGGSDGSAGGRLAWLVLALYVVLGLAMATLLVYVARFMRGSWSP